MSGLHKSVFLQKVKTIKKISALLDKLKQEQCKLDLTRAAIHMVISDNYEALSFAEEDKKFLSKAIEKCDDTKTTISSSLKSKLLARKIAKCKNKPFVPKPKALSPFFIKKDEGDLFVDIDLSKK